MAAFEASGLGRLLSCLLFCCFCSSAMTKDSDHQLGFQHCFCSRTEPQKLLLPQRDLVPPSPQGPLSLTAKSTFIPFTSLTRHGWCYNTAKHLKVSQLYDFRGKIATCVHCMSLRKASTKGQWGGDMNPRALSTRKRKVVLILTFGTQGSLLEEGS